MPLLLRRSAPSPSIDQLAFAVPAAPLATGSNGSSSNNSNNASNLRASTGSEAHFAQLQRCSTHARMSMARRRSTASINDTELLCSHASCENEECSDPQHAHPLQMSESFEAEDVVAERDPSFRASSKKASSSQDDQQDDEDTATSEWGYGSDAGRASSVPSCACSCRDDDACAASSTVTIEDKQLAVVDMELRDLRKTFATKLYTRISNMSKSFGRKRGSSHPQLTAS